MRILVVEDDRKVSSFIRQGLEEEGHTVETAADGVGALDLLLEGEPVEVDRQPVRTVEELKTRVDRHAKGEPMVMLVNREGRPMYVAIPA